MIATENNNDKLVIAGLRVAVVPWALYKIAGLQDQL